MLSNRDFHHHVMMPWHAQADAAAANTISRAEGCFLFDDQDRPIFDFSSGWVAANLGHGNRDIIDAVTAQMEQLYYAPPIFKNHARAQLAEELSDLSPWADGCRVHFTTGGGEANDDAIKVARLATGRTKVMAAYRSYHGTTGTAAGVTGDMRRWASEPAVFPVVRFFAPYPYRSPFHTDDSTEETRRAMDHLHRIVTQEGAHNIAALIIEPMVGSSGMICYPDGYLTALRDFTRRHGILLIFDEVMTGFGRLGVPFAANRFGVAPDMITFAKGVNGAALPLGGVMLSEDLASRFDAQVFDAGHTHAGHPVAMASGLGALKALRERNLFARSLELEAVFSDRLEKMKSDVAIIGDVRGAGAFFGIELVADRRTREPLVDWYAEDASLNARLTERLFELGVWVYSRYGILMLAPPLVATDAEVLDALDQVETALVWLQNAAAEPPDITVKQPS